MRLNSESQRGEAMADDFELEENTEDSIYGEKSREDSLDEDSLSASEEAFMRGYDEALEHDEKREEE